jgi:hypothetical protein
MDSFRSYMLREAYSNIEKLGDRLAEADQLIDWEAFNQFSSA